MHASQIFVGDSAAPQSQSQIIEILVHNGTDTCSRVCNCEPIQVSVNVTQSLGARTLACVQHANANNYARALRPGSLSMMSYMTLSELLA
jgi:hypothetical protein